MDCSFCSWLLKGSELLEVWCAMELLQRLGVQKGGFPKAISEYAIARFYWSVLVLRSIKFPFRLIRAGEQIVWIFRCLLKSIRFLCLKGVFCLCLTSSSAVVWNFILDPNGPCSFTQTLYIVKCWLIWSHKYIFFLCLKVLAVSKVKL